MQQWTPADSPHDPKKQTRSEVTFRGQTRGFKTEKLARDASTHYGLDRSDALWDIRGYREHPPDATEQLLYVCSPVKGGDDFPRPVY